MSDILTVRIKLAKLAVQRLTTIDSQRKGHVVTEPMKQDKMVSLIECDGLHTLSLK